MGSRFRPDDIWDLEWFDWTNELTNVTSTSSPGQFAPYPSEQRKLGTECKQATSHPKNRRRLGTRLKLLMILTYDWSMVFKPIICDSACPLKRFQKSWRLRRENLMNEEASHVKYSQFKLSQSGKSAKA